MLLLTELCQEIILEQGNAKTIKASQANLKQQWEDVRACHDFYGMDNMNKMQGTTVAG